LIDYSSSDSDLFDIDCDWSAVHCDWSEKIGPHFLRIYHISVFEGADTRQRLSETRRISFFRNCVLVHGETTVRQMVDTGGKSEGDLVYDSGCQRNRIVFRDEKSAHCL